jgi:two-component system C4-dicarboxylate transport response regulator DctD
MLKLKERIRHIGPVPVDVLIHGATGTGKEVVARHLHDASGRAGPFVAVNCGALPETVFESEMFGHEAGAYRRGKRRIGKLEHASGGTLFLDEIESMPLALQVKLLRALQERQIERLGGNQLIPLDLRVVAAAKTDLLALSQRQQFREDLYFRLAVVQLMLPALQDRRDDIPLLLQHFTAQAAQRFGLPVLHGARSKCSNGSCANGRAMCVS